ncbi:MAG: thioredoxin domain-containing protein [Deltaproteobacteria bacterium]|nr:thioredoxin domain-containing protein [Deltaproteobacteria bacterium]MCW5802254.1 thioredoxin domain-containing protein [Deltaproteobacteria bacterium]
MSRVAALVLVLAACRPPPAAGTEALDARIKKLEDTVAKYSEALEFLGEVYAQQKDQIDKRAEREPAPDAIFAVEIARSAKLGQVEGPASAPVTIVKAFDFACPHCARTNDTLAELLAANPGKLRVVFKNMVVHKEAMPAHLASCAAAKQGKYLEYKNAFWKHGFGPYAESGGRDKSSLEADNLVKIATDMGLDVSRFKVDMVGVDCENAIKADMDELVAFKVDGTPTFFINGTEIPGAVDRETFQQLIDEKLKLVAASGVAGGDYYQKVVIGKGEKKFRAKKDPKPK